MPNSLNDRQRRFADALVNGGFPTQWQAYQSVYQCGYGRARANAAKLANTSDFQAHRKKLEEANAQESRLRRRDLLSFYAAAVETPIDEIDGSSPLCQEKTVTEGRDGVSTKMKSISKVDAGREIAKMTGLYSAEKVDHRFGSLAEAIADVVKSPDVVGPEPETD